MTKLKKVQRCAACLRISIFILNGFVWLGALFAIVCGLMVGFSNGTFSLDAEEDDDYVGGEIRWRDALFTTPATLLVYYGVLMLITAIFGCFAGAGGRRCCNITFVIAIILTIIFDIIFGYLFFFNPFAMHSFIQHLDKSMDSYGVENNAAFGVIPYHPTAYWDYLQRTGSCCGKFAPDEWRGKRIGSQKNDFSLPDSCCTKDYDYRRCGWRVWIHMEGDMDHYRSEMLKKVGCLNIFPSEVTTKYEEISYIVIILGLFMIICLICAIVLLCLIFTKKYQGGQGPQQLPRFARATPHRPAAGSRDYSINDENDSRYQDVDFATTRKQGNVLSLSQNRDSVSRSLDDESGGRFSVRRGRNRVHPEIQSDEVVKPRRLSEPKDVPEPRGVSILKPAAVGNRDSTHRIYTNQSFGAHSDIEELPEVYRQRAITRIRETSLDPRTAMSR